MNERGQPSHLREFLARSGRKQVQVTEPEVLLPFLCALCFDAEEDFGATQPVWIIARSLKESKSLFQNLREMERLSSRSRTKLSQICWLPPLFKNPFTDFATDPDRVWAHMGTIHRLSSGPAPRLVISCPEALVSRTVPRALLEEHNQSINTGDLIDRDALLLALDRSGYARADLVTEPGQIAVRGGIIDIFPPHRKRPIRLDLFDDEVDRISVFHPQNQRSLGTLSKAAIPPVVPYLYSDDALEPVQERIRQLATDRKVPSLRLATHIDDLQQRYTSPGAIAFLPCVIGRLQPIADWMGPEDSVLFLDRNRLYDTLDDYFSRIHQSAAQAHKNHRLANEFCDFFVPGADDSTTALKVLLDQANSVELTSMLLDEGDLEKTVWSIEMSSVAHLGIMLQSKQNPQQPFLPVAEQIQAWVSKGLAVHLVAADSNQRRRLKTLLESYEVTICASKSEWVRPHDPGVYIWSGSVQRGFVCSAFNTVLVSDIDLFGPRQKAKPKSQNMNQDLLLSFRELQPGDVVVHKTHGIAQFENLTRMKVGKTEADFLELIYAKGAKLFLPVSRIGLIQKYVSSGKEGFKPPLHKLGGTRWKSSKKKAKKAAEIIASKLLKLYAERAQSKGYAFSPTDEFYEQFAASFPFQETPDQARAIQEVLEDMQKERPMDRLVCGDVGYGKTEVALRAAFKAIQDSKQVAVLVPTTILAEQHYLTMKARLSPFGLRVEQLSRFISPAKQQETLRELQKGRVDLVVGTHRLLQKDVRFKDLGLLVIDEEHRFGVKHKELIKNYRSDADVLCLSATPIPRTLHMALMKIRDLSTITTAPPGRQAVSTKVARFDSPVVTQGIVAELKRRGQVYYVTNRIHGMDQIQEELQKRAPKARISMAHGQMSPRVLEDIMRKFIRGEIDILLATTIIESGIDVPNANTMFIHHAERFGLAQLYQLRGRIGRSNKKAHCTFLVPHPKALTEEAHRRISVLQRMSSLGSGFSLAIEDMELRGAGNLLGREQHGQIDAIGYQGFMDLLQETIRELRGAQGDHQIETEVEIDVTAFLPDDYLPDPHDRLTLYRRLASVRTQADLMDLVQEIEDRYGKLPLEAQALVRVNNLRVNGQEVGITQIIAKGARVRLGLSEHGPGGAPLNPAIVTRFVSRPKNRWTLRPDMSLERKLSETERVDLVGTTEALVREYSRWIKSKG